METAQEHRIARISSAPLLPLAGRSWEWGRLRWPQTIEGRPTAPTLGPSPQGGGEGAAFGDDTINGSGAR
ncbi:hypothetical protein ASF49_13810 [Methylobacterium sp. Leaf104]|nr:hypothetical protein ASF49_13810 [Methylobacterium sp. Leaf104]